MGRMTRVPLLAGLALVAAACGSDEGGTIQIGGQPANDHGSAEVAAGGEIEFELDDFYFRPTVLSGEAGQDATLELFNEGGEAHTFTVDEIGVDVELQPEQRVRAEVTFPESGALLVYCRFHAARGMRGALSVGGDLTTSKTSLGGTPGGGATPGTGSPAGGYGGYG